MPLLVTSCFGHGPLGPCLVAAHAPVHEMQAFADEGLLHAHFDPHTSGGGLNGPFDAAFLSSSLDMATVELGVDA